MQQTFYIDGDEEISSVIEKLRKSLSVENFFVLPKRALVMQSIVNLKLLKREADKMKKRVTLVTQDEINVNMAARAGIMVRSSTEGLESIRVQDDFAMKEASIENNVQIEKKIKKIDKVRLNNVGTDDFYDNKWLEYRKNHSYESDKNRIEKPRVSKEDVKIKINKGIQAERKNTKPVINLGKNTGNFQYAQGLDPQKEQGIEKIFSDSAASKKEIAEISIKGKTKKIALAFILAGLVIFGGIAVYLFVPKAQIFVSLASQKKKLDVDLTGNLQQIGVDAQNKIIPINILQTEEEVVLTREATGKSDLTGAKSRGKIAIYNEYSNEAQTLVATTRFETEDGKIFRLVKNVVVPGASQTDGELKPGAIDAEIIADEPGGDYNLESANFTIPGFKESPKFSKFSAKLLSPTVGGGQSDEVVKAITQRDVENAKLETESQLKEKVLNSLQKQFENGEIMVDGAMQYNLIESNSDVKAGEVMDSFEYHAKAKAQVIVFRQVDVEKILADAYKQTVQTENDEIEKIRIDYAGVTPDFEKKTLTMKLHSEISIKTKLDEEKIKKDFLGKDASGIENLVKTYPQIKNVNVEFEPNFVSRVPQYAHQVQVEFKAED